MTPVVSRGQETSILTRISLSVVRVDFSRHCAVVRNVLEFVIKDMITSKRRTFQTLFRWSVKRESLCSVHTRGAGDCIF